MADNRLKQLAFTFTYRAAPKSGPTSSDKWNDSFTELANDFSSLTHQWNSQLLTVFNGLPAGEEDSAVDAFKNGLDGKNLWVDQLATSEAEDTVFFNIVKDRPNTIREQFENVYSTITDRIQELDDALAILDTSGLTTEQKNRIGAAVFDTSEVSSASSIDGKTEANRLNIVQLAIDLYGEDLATLNADGEAILDNASTKDMLAALLEIHNSSYNSTDDPNHDGVFTPTQADVNSSAPGSDGFSGSPVNLQEDLNQIRTRIKAYAGTTGWLTNPTALYTSGADSLQELLVSTQGQGTKSATNPWGYRYDNIDGLVTLLSGIAGYVGQDNLTDTTPDYSSTNFISNGDSLETAIGKLDQNIAADSGVQISMQGQLAALEVFVGQNSDTDSSPQYSGTYVTNGFSLETAIHQLDARLVLESGINNLISSQLGALQTFVGQNNTTDSTPAYSGVYATNGSSLESAIHSLDVQLQTVTNAEVTSFFELDEITGGDTFNGSIKVTQNLTTSGTLFTQSGIQSYQDIEVIHAGSGIVLASPNGTRYRLTVTNSGILNIAAV